jgi:hypothetical protein
MLPGAGIVKLYPQFGMNFQRCTKMMKIGKIDFTMNEVEGVSIKGYPTLVFYLIKKESNLKD